MIMRVRTKLAELALTFILVLLSGVQPAFAVSKEIIQLQTQVQTLSDQVARLQQSLDERMGVLRSLVEQSTDSVNKMSTAVNELQQKSQTQSADNSSRLDQVSGQVQSLHDSVDELKARLAKISKQLDDIQQNGQNINAGQPGMTAVPGAPPAGNAAVSAAPPPDVLYNNAFRDYNSGKYDLSSQEFSDYLKYYGTTDRAGDAQYYLADIEYRQGNFDAAVKDYDKVLEEYPGGSKASAAQLKKGYALLELGQREAGVRELNSLIARYPRSVEAAQARDRLKRLGVTASAPPPRSTEAASLAQAQQSDGYDSPCPLAPLRRRSCNHALGQHQLSGLATKLWQVHTKYDSPGDARHAADGNRPRCSYTMRDGPGEERSKRRHSHKHHRVNRNHSAAHLVWRPSIAAECSTTPSAPSW